MRDSSNGLVKRTLSRRATMAGVAVLTATMFRLPQIAAQTPVGVGTDIEGPERLRNLLALVPASIMPSSGALFDWLDLEMHFTAAGLTYPLDDIPPVEYMTPLVSNDPLMQWANDPETRELLGFSSFDIHQSLSVGTPPAMVQIYRGGVAFRDLTQTWETGGYEAVSGEFGEFWTRGQDGEIDFQDPLQRVVMARLNNIAILDDSTIACAPTAALLGTVVRGGASMADSPDLAPLLDRLPTSTANVMGISGDVFAVDTVMAGQVLQGEDAFRELQDALAESDDAVGPMPRIRSVIGGVSAGTRQDRDEGQSAFLSILPLSDDHAGGVADVIFWRYEHMTSPVTGDPYTDMLSITNTAESSIDGPVVRVELSAQDAARGAWFRLVVNRDVLMFAW